MGFSSDSFILKRNFIVLAIAIVEIVFSASTTLFFSNVSGLVNNRFQPLIGFL